MSQNPKVPQEIWSSYIVEKLRKTNPHLNLSFDESQHVKGGSVVYIPQSGSKPNVVKNRPYYPADVTKRNDTAIMYALDDYTSDPTLMPTFENMEISYNKTDSVLGDHTLTLAETIGDEIIYNWIRGLKPVEGGGVSVEFLPSANKIFTSGEASDVNYEDGQTGQRKILSYKEIQQAQAKMNKSNVAKEGRYAMLESYMYQQFIDSLSQNQMAAFQQSTDLSNGIVGKFAGFTFLERSSVLAFSEAGDVIVPGEALGASDNLASFLWQKDSVTRALGDTKIYQDLDDPRYYGDIYSGQVKMGGRCRREDWKGVLAIVQSAI
jgi:hypothetical protein